MQGMEGDTRAGYVSWPGPTLLQDLQHHSLPLYSQVP